MRNNKKINDHIHLEILNSYLHGTKGKYTIEKENSISIVQSGIGFVSLGWKTNHYHYMKDKAASTSNEDVSSEENITSLKVHIKQLESDLKRPEMAHDMYDCMIGMVKKKYHFK